MMPLAIHRRITLRLATDDPGLMVGDEDLIERVFTNMVGNAIKFTPESGAITLTIASDADAVRCCVEDTGEGIPAQYVRKLFEKYQQVEEQRRGGTGLGLAICKHIVEAHFGRIWVESTFGKGSKFYFTMPRNLVQEGEEVRVGAKSSS
jgi:signal transduction histidine kinase